MTPPGRRTPTAAQRRVLEAMRDGADLRSAWNQWQWYFEGDGEIVNDATAKSLQTAGWIRCHWKTGELRKYQLTYAGTAALHPAADDAGVK